MNDNNKKSAFEESVDNFSHNDINGNADDEKRALLPSLIMRSATPALNFELLAS